MKSAQIEIAGRMVGEGAAPFVIAEMSGNHNQSLERALELVDAAAESGAHAIKIQTYTADTMTLDLRDDGFMISDPDSLWSGKSLYELYEQAHTPWEWHEAIFRRARKKGLVAFSTPFDETAVEFLEHLDAPCYKIASFEITDIPLIRKVATTGKPMILSTGMATVAELDEAVRAARDGGCRDLVLLKCTSTYPASAENSNLATIPHMRELFRCQVGLSDHTLGTGAAIAAVALGATVVEKHFTLRRADGGVDAAFSMEPQEMRSLVEESERAWQALGEVRYGPLAQESGSLKFRRSIYVSRDIREGEPLTRDNIRIVRPGYGLPPGCITTVLGKRVRQDVRRGTPLGWELIG